MSPRRYAVAFVVALLVLAACSGGDIAENILEGQDGLDNVDISENGGTVSLDFEGEDGESGSMTFGGGDLPDDMPIDIPDGGEVVAVVSVEGSGHVSLLYSDDYASVISFFEGQIASGGFDESQKIESGPPPVTTWILQRGDLGVSVSVSESTDGTTVIVIYGSA